MEQVSNMHALCTRATAIVHLQHSKLDHVENSNQIAHGCVSFFIGRYLRKTCVFLPRQLDAQRIVVTESGKVVNYMYIEITILEGNRVCCTFGHTRRDAVASRVVEQTEASVS